MITMPAHALWVLLAVWLAVVLCAFMFGWYARAYRAEHQAQLEVARRRHPSTRYQPGHLPRAGRLHIDQADDTAVDIARWWPALERQVTEPPPSRAQVEISNWERNLRRKQDAWLHERGMQ